MRIRPEQEGDAAAIHALTTAAFGQPDEAFLVDRLRADGDVAISLVMEQPQPITDRITRQISNQLTGHVLFSTLATPTRMLALAPVSVAPQLQHQGIGARLIRHGLSAAHAAGWQAVFVLGHPDYYTRFGFSVAATAPFTSPYASPYFMALELASGALKTPDSVTYPPAFTRL